MIPVRFFACGGVGGRWGADSTTASRIALCLLLALALVSTALLGSVPTTAHADDSSPDIVRTEDALASVESNAALAFVESNASPASVESNAALASVESNIALAALEPPSLRLRPPRARHPFRALAEEVTFLAIGATWYWADHERNLADWDFPSWRQRFTSEAVRFDNNEFGINFLWHPLSGSAYYGFPRANGLSWPVSFAYAATTSVLWEYALEFREKISINDLLVTSTSGLALGEFFVRLSTYLNSAPGGGSRLRRAIAWTLGFPIRFHDAIDRHPHAPTHTPRDDLGYDPAIAHRFRTSYGLVLGRTPSSEFVAHELSIGGELVALPGYLRPVTRRSYFGDANRSSFSLRGIVGNGSSGVEMRADAVLLGLFSQRIRETSTGLRGHALTLGAAMGYLYRWDEVPGYVDRFSMTHLPGVALDLDGLAGRASVRFSLRGHGDFAGMNAALYDAWQAENVNARPRTTLLREGYYYGFGLSVRAAFEVEVPRASFGASALYGHYASKDGLDRSQEMVTNDVHGEDRILDASGFVRVKPIRNVPIEIELAAATTRRVSRLGELRGSHAYDRFTLRVLARY